MAKGHSAELQPIDRHHLPAGPGIACRLDCQPSASASVAIHGYGIWHSGRRCAKWGPDVMLGELLNVRQMSVGRGRRQVVSYHRACYDS